MENKLSVVIITLNEARNIGRCIDSVMEIADDIVVVDSFSTDGTAEICLSKGARFFQEKWLGYSETKNLGNSLAKYDWIFSIDADEAISDELKQSILQAKQNPYQPVLRICRFTNYCGKWIHHCGWYPDIKVRFFDRRKTHWEGFIHERLNVEDESSAPLLKGDCYHYSYYTREGHLQKSRLFSELAATDLFQRNKNAAWPKQWISPLLKFIKMYFLKMGFLDGTEGYNIAKISSHAVFNKYAVLRQIRKRDIINKNKPRIIISRTDNIGDVVLALPIAGVLKKMIPDAYIIFLGKSYTEDIISMSSCVDKFVDWEIIKNQTEAAQIQSFRELNADYIIHAFPVKQIAGFAKKAGIQNRIGATGRLYHWTNCNKPVRMTRRRSKLHEAQLNLKLLKPLGINRIFSVKEIIENYQFSTPDVLHEKYTSLLKPDKFNLILHPKSNGSTREWSVEKYSELISILPEDKFRIFISGTANDTDLIQEGIMAKHASVVDLSGKLSLKEFISFIAKADGMVACSTGPLHIAAALGKWVIGIYPPIKPMHPGRWAPIGTKASYLVKETDCSQCRKALHCECIDSITPEMVKVKLLEFIQP